MDDDREKQGLRRPFTREELTRQRAVKLREALGSTTRKMAEAKLADMENREADFER